MSDLALGRERAAAPASSVSDLYRAIWRWHFYAGLLVLPFMITLAITGGLYLFREELDAVIHSGLKQVAVAEGTAPLPVSELVAAALASQPGKAVKIITPATPETSLEVTVAAEAGKRAVYVNPYTGAVLGSLPDRGTAMWTVRYLHSLRYFGPVTRGIIEIAGGWSILLVGTGIYLWWPRRQTGGVLSVRGTPKRRVFWRDLHAVTGLFVGGIIAFLALTGMPWSGNWGAKVNEWANGTNYGYPSGVYVGVPMSAVKLDDVEKTAWSLEQAKIPETPVVPAAAAPVGIDAAVAEFRQLGLVPGFAVALPKSETGVYSGTVYPDDLTRQRVVHLDQYTGKPLVDFSYADYGPAAKAIEWGINTHMGQQYGVLNQIVLALACAAIVLLAVSAGVMWWKRRPAGGLGVPPLPSDLRVFRGVIVLLVLGGLLFPLTGLSLIVLLAIDLVVVRLQRRRQTART